MVFFLEDIGIFGINDSQSASEIRLYDSEALEEVGTDQHLEFAKINSNLG